MGSRGRAQRTGLRPALSECGCAYVMVMTDDRADITFDGKVFALHTVHPLGGGVRVKATDSFWRINGYDNLRERRISDPGLCRLQPVHDHHRDRRTQYRSDPARQARRSQRRAVATLRRLCCYVTVTIRLRIAVGAQW